MKAITQDRYGALADVLVLRDIDPPAVGDRAVLVRIHATPVSGSDWHLYRGLPYAARPVTGLRRPRNRIPGLELAGTVESVGGQVTGFAPGDEVFGWCDGSLAEYAAVPISGFTALQGARDRGQVQPGQHVLITGAAGGVGTYAVQIAKAYGAEVTAVCSTSKLDLVRSIGADHVIDYTKQDFADGGARYDVLIDIYGNPSLARCRRALKPHGTLVFIGGTGGRFFMGVDRWLRAQLLSPFIRTKVRLLIHKDRKEDLATLKALIESGKVRPILDRTVPLTEVAEAIQHVREGRARGQVVVTIAR